MPGLHQWSSSQKELALEASLLSWRPLPGNQACGRLKPWVGILPPPPVSCVTLDKLSSLSEPQFPQFKTR